MIWSGELAVLEGTSPKLNMAGGERGQKIGTIGSNALSHDTSESFERPSPYPGLRVGTDIIAISGNRAPLTSTYWIRILTRQLSGLLTPPTPRS